MRKIILSMGMSLDGYIEGPGREIDWHVVDDELLRHFNDEARAWGGFLLGRVMYERLTADFRPITEAGADAADSGPEAEFVGIWQEKPKYVYSRTLERADGNTTIVRDVVPEEVAALKAAPGGDLVLGGAGIAAAFLREDLVDAYRIYVHPVRIGRGKPLFPPVDGGPVPLRLEGTRTFGNGVVLLSYGRP